MIKLPKYRLCGLILAAGLGTRLRPLSEKIPKPLLPICGRPIIQIIIDKLSDFDVRDFAINTHYRPELIRKFLEENGYANCVRTFHEEKILGTGGVLSNCRAFLSEFDSFILHNGDIVTDIDLDGLVHKHVSSGATATMALINGPENRVLSFGGSVGDICGRLEVEPPSTSKLMTYSGVSVFSRKIFDYVPEQPAYTTLVDILIKAISARPGSVKGFVPENFYWNDVGTFRKYFDAHEDIILHKKMKLPGLRIKNGRVLGEGTCIPRNSHSEGFLCTGKNCSVIPESKLRNCIMFDDTRIDKAKRHYDEILWRQETFHKDTNALSELRVLGKAGIAGYRVSTLAEQGSARKFYRLDKNGNSKVLMVSSAEDKDFSRFIRIGGFLSGLDIGLPEIYGFDKKEFTILMEDLGDGILHDLVKEHGVPPEKIYKKVIDLLFKFQTSTCYAKEKCLKAVNRKFDFAGIRWESEYFTENFLNNYLGVPKKTIDNLNPVFDYLAEESLNQPQVLIHRDFQSQNIIIKDGRVRIIDFQGARLGPLCYDMMSLVWDPYVKLSHAMRSSLMNYYFAKFADDNIPTELSVRADEFAKFAIVAGLQRLMQALGAYSFLSMQKGKTAFLKHIPAGLENLNMLIAESEKLDGIPEGLATLKKIIAGKLDHRLSSERHG